VLSIVGDFDGTTVKEVADVMNRDEERVEHAVGKLKERGELYERNGEIFRT